MAALRELHGRMGAGARGEDVAAHHVTAALQGTRVAEGRGGGALQVAAEDAHAGPVGDVAGQPCGNGEGGRVWEAHATRPSKADHGTSFEGSAWHTKPLQRLPPPSNRNILPPAQSLFRRVAVMHTVFCQCAGKVERGAGYAAGGGKDG